MAVMLDIAADMQFRDASGLRSFFLDHRLAHDANASAIQSKFATTVPGLPVASDFALAEWIATMESSATGEKPPGRALKDWLLFHQSLHQAEYDALGFGEAPDLSEADFSDKSQFETWMQDHKMIHDIVGNALGVA